MDAEESLDEFDRRLLDLLQRDARKTAEEMGAVVGLSASAVQKRIKRLREYGIIDRDVSILSASFIGHFVMSIVRVKLAPDVRDGGAAFEREVKDTAEITQCYHVTGDFDYLLFVHTRDLRAFNELIERFFKGNPHLARYETHLVLKPVKRGLEAPL